MATTSERTGWWRHEVTGVYYWRGREWPSIHREEPQRGPYGPWVLTDDAGETSRHASLDDAKTAAGLS